MFLLDVRKMWLLLQESRWKKKIHFFIGRDWSDGSSSKFSVKPFNLKFIVLNVEPLNKRLKLIIVFSHKFLSLLFRHQDRLVLFRLLIIRKHDHINFVFIATNFNKHDLLVDLMEIAIQYYSHWINALLIIAYIEWGRSFFGYHRVA